MLKKIIVDTNCWVSFILSKKSGSLPDFFTSEEIDFYFSSDLLKEISSTLNYARSIKRTNDLNYKRFLFFIRSFAVLIESVSVVDVCRDAKDNFLLALAKDAKADYLITRDQDLLILKKFENTLVVTLNQFVGIIKENDKDK